MNNHLIKAAVAAVLATGVANAANVDIYISGASAQRNFWRDDIKANICKTSTQITYTTTNSGAGQNPDNAAYRCPAVAAGTPALPANINDGDTVTMHYSAEYGSLYGIAPFIARAGTAPNFNKRLFVNPDSADCTVVGTAGTCALTSYDPSAEAFTSTNGDAMTSTIPDVGVTDLEASKFGLSANWTNGLANLAPQPAQSDLNAFALLQKPINGQVFTIIVNNASPITGTNISTASARAILTGQYKTWGQVPEVGDKTNTNNIIVARRDAGSGSEVETSLYFAGTECGVSGAPIVSAASGNKLNAPPVEYTSTGKLAAAVIADANTIGFRSISVSGLYKTLSLDGVEPNAHNAAAGFYPYASETYLYDNRANSAPTAGDSALITALISDARTATKLTPGIENGVLAANGQWASAGGQKGYYAMPVLSFGNTASISHWITTTAAPTGLGTRFSTISGGDSCKALLNTNSTL